MYPLVIPSGTGETLFSADLLSTDVFFGYHVWFTLDESPYRNDLISQPPTILWPVGESLVPKHWVHGDWQLTGWKPIGPSKHHNFCHQSFVFFFCRIYEFVSKGSDKHPQHFFVGNTMLFCRGFWGAQLLDHQDLVLPHAATMLALFIRMYSVYCE